MKKVLFLILFFTASSMKGSSHTNIIKSVTQKTHCLFTTYGCTPNDDLAVHFSLGLLTGLFFHKEFLYARSKPAAATLLIYVLSRFVIEATKSEAFDDNDISDQILDAPVNYALLAIKDVFSVINDVLKESWTFRQLLRSQPKNIPRHMLSIFTENVACFSSEEKCPGESDAKKRDRRNVLYFMLGYGIGSYLKKFINFSPPNPPGFKLLSGGHQR